MNLSRFFISHSSQDDAFVRALREALDLHGLPGWIDSRELRGGDPLWAEIEKAIDASFGYAVVVSTASLQSKWVGRELRHALELRKQRGGNTFYPVVPLSLDGTRLGVLEEFFDEEPIYLPVSSGAGGVAAAIDPILVALGRRAPADRAEAAQPQAEPVEELVLELTDLKFQVHEGVRRATARARLVYEPAAAGQPEVASAQAWRFIAPLGPIEAEELRWYLEKYAIWPGGWFRDRAKRVEADLVTWGQRLHGAALPAASTGNVMAAWAGIDGQAGRRFSVHVDATATLEAGAPEADVTAAHEAATTLLGLPWELLHDGRRFLFQGAQPTRVRRRLPNTQAREVPVVAPPIRVLLVTARPEDDACGYLDHRASAAPLVDATEALGELVQVTLLDPPTLHALRTELDRARAARQPYHVLHFDGHGVYDRRVGLGGLCFEDPRDSLLLEGRRHATVYTPELGALLDEHRIPLVFLEACQTAQAEQASESVATALLGAGVAAVAAMSHSVLVESSRRFVQAFYRSLAGGARVGGAMLAGQRELKDDNFRGRVFGAGELRLEDWFVPVLYQEKADPQLFTATPTRQTQDDVRTALQARLGELPPAPETGFIGRSRELLALQRLLRGEHTARYAVLRGQGGEGKTALATEFARWMVRSQQVRRAAFVSVETHGSAQAVLDAIGRQLGHGFSAAAFDSAERATFEVERLLAERSTLIVVDNMESVLLPPYLETPELLSEDARRELQAILALCRRLLAKGDTRIVFTSREALPAPFDGERQRRELRQLEREDAVRLIERALNREAGGGGSGDGSVAGQGAGSGSTPGALAAEDAEREAIEQLADAVHGHARTLALLAPAIRSRGVAATQASLVELMAEMDLRFPGSRERSVYASVELSLQRLSPAQRERAQVLAAFHGAVDLDALRVMTRWDEADIATLATQLVATGLATPDSYNHLSLNPALCPYLRGRLEEPEREALQGAWVGAMDAYAGFLMRQQSRNTDIAATLTALELPNLFALLEAVQRAGDAAATIDFSTTLYSLLQNIGKPRLVERVGQVRDAAAAALGEGWSHVGFQAQRTRIEQQLAGGRLREAFEGAQALLERARGMGEQAYDGADYDLASVCWLLGRVLQMAGGADQALSLIDEAQQRFEAVERARPNCGAASMASKCVTERGDCLRDLGRLDEAATAYEEGIQGAEQLGDERSAAVAKGQLGTVRQLQGRHADALKAHQDARERFTRLGEPRTVATSWHQTGMVHQEAGQPEAAEDAYRRSLALKVQLGDAAGQANSLGQLGNLYADALGRPEEAVAFYRQAADLYVGIRDVAKEGFVRSNLADALLQLGPARLGEARQEIRRAIECMAPFGHAAVPWMTWSILARIETEAGNPGAAAEAKAKAVAAYLAYRRAGGENHQPQGRLALAVTDALRSGGPDTAAELLQQFAADAKLPASLRPFVEALQAVVAGNRERSLADAPELSYSMSAEILLLVETLEAQR
jgi:tetratricopeptide (TPR) repeat protein